MTATHAPAPAAPASQFARAVQVVRLHLVNRWTYIGTPWLITVVAFAISVVIFLLIRATVGPEDYEKAVQGMAYSWAVASPLWYMVVVGVQAVSSTFPFALGISVTRREFALGTGLTFVVMSAINATGWTLLNLIERTTNGFGFELPHFTSMWFGGLDVGGVWVSWFTAQLLLFSVGAAFAAIYVRWRTFGLVLTWILLTVVVLGGIALVVLTGSAPAVAEWLAGVSLTAFFASLLVPAALALVVGWVVLRWATPRS